MLRFLLAIGIGLPIFGGLAAWYGFKEKDIAQASSQTPETISLSKLIARGPEGNANIILTDYTAIRPHVVQRGRRGRYSGSWVPIVPKDAAGPGGEGATPKGVKAFVFSDKGRDPEAVYQRLSNPQLAGMVTNKIMTPNSGAEDELKELYPQTDFATCIFIHEGREPASEEKSAFMIYGGFLMILIGIGALGLCLFLWRKSAAEDARRKKRRDDDDDDEDYRPRKRRKIADDDDDGSPRRKRHPADDEDDAPPRKRRPVSRDDDEDDRPRRKRSADYDDDDDRPRRRSRRDDD
jgi:hypothetical protein